MKKILAILAGISLPFLLNAQADTILVFNLNTHTTATILPTPFNAVVTSDHSSSYPGNMFGLATLPQTIPTSNVFSGSNFTKLGYASSFFNLTDYPVRTVLRITTYQDSLHYFTSAMMVGPCFAMISAANITNFGPQPSFIAFDSILIDPAFNNGLRQVNLPRTRVKKIYAFKSFVHDGNLQEDIALLELADPIGLQIGWTGIGFDSTPNFTSGKIYHKFSYPTQINPFDSTKVYNGDTLYYNYGLISDMGAYLGVNSNEAQGIPGQAGSTFLYKDNSDYYSVGLFLFSNSYSHPRISNQGFYRMQNVLNTQICAYYTSIHETTQANAELNFFPNPMATEATLQFEYDPTQRYSLSILNVLGQQVGQVIRVDSGTIRITRDNLALGIYFLKLQTANSERVCKMVVE